MTDYLATNRPTKWQKDKDKRKTKSLFAFFIVIVLLFAAINGILKSREFSKNITKSSLDSASSFTATLGERGQSLFVFQKDPKRIVVLKGILDSGQNGLELVNLASKTWGAPIQNYIILKDVGLEKAQDLEDNFSNFTSILTPLKIISTGWQNDTLDTNVTRIDALRLWWQLKSFGVEDLKIADFTGGDQRSGKTTLGANSQDLNREISKYTENLKIVNEDFDINVLNSSGSDDALTLAVLFLRSQGAKVSSINGSTNIIQKCEISSSTKSYTLVYLAKIFECDINDEFEADEGQIFLTLGSNFASKYIE